MASQIARRSLLRLGRCMVLQNRQLSHCVTRTSTCLRSPLRNSVQVSRHMATQQKFESFNVQDTDDFKQRVLESSTPVIVDFHATWCGPCKLLGPRLESIASAQEGKVQLAKIDVDDNADLAMSYNVQSVPTVIGFKNGKQLDSFIGLKDDDQIRTFIEKLLN